ncbi:response regulator transcription factor [Nocardioides daejeonensis]|uniref:response regulator transcription factor n=1 Tax=Nocardioides daejeonensis TaxID=1046556 RepID=UPI0013A536DE|nr:helix-turn-helix transcriptional regulator [Nocardioides daejeonensis]
MSSTHRAALIASADAEREELRVIRTQLDRLTRREVQILRALMTGATVNQIARSDVVAIGTVRSQVKSILSKLDTNSQVGAVSAAYRVSWHPPRS